MDSIQEKFWLRRFSNINCDINNNVQNIYTWALLLKESIKTAEQWVEDKPNITGIPFCEENLFIKEKKLCNLVLDLVILGKTNYINEQTTTLYNNTTNYKQTNTVDNTNENIDIEFESDTEENDSEKKLKEAIRDLNTSCNNELNTSCNNDLPDDNAEYMRILNAKLVSKQDKDHEELDTYIDERREKMKKDIKCPVPSNNNVKFNLSTVNDTLPHQVKLPSDCETNETKRPDLSLFAGNITKTVDEMVRDAPTITPLFRLTQSELNKLMREFFENAKRRVFSSLSTNTDLTPQLLNNIYLQKDTNIKTVTKQPTRDELETLIIKEANRLQEVYKEENKNTRTHL